MKHLRSISATKISSFLCNIDNYGISVEEVLKLVKVDKSVLSEPDNRLSGEEANQIIQSAAILTRDKHLGLHQGERIAKGFSNILGYILLNCATLEECWKNYCKYEKIIDSTSISDFDLRDDYVVISNTTVDKVLSDNIHFTEFKIAGILTYIKLLTNKTLHLHEVHFTHSKPDDISEYNRIFRCNVYFNKAVNAIIFEKEQLNISLIESNRHLLALFESHADELLKAYTDSSYANKVTEIILTYINKCSIPTIDEVAKNLLISTRSLQLYLQKEGTTFTKLVNNFRKNYAEACLKERNISADEIAYLLGFSETSAFHRAFKCWTGSTPMQYRKLYCTYLNS